MSSENDFSKKEQYKSVKSATNIKASKAVLGS